MFLFHTTQKLINKQRKKLQERERERGRRGGKKKEYKTYKGKRDYSTKRGERKGKEVYIQKNENGKDKNQNKVCFPFPFFPLLIHDFTMFVFLLLHSDVLFSVKKTIAH